MSSSGASCFFTLFNLQGARPTSAAGTHLVYHTVLLLSSTFFKLFSELFSSKSSNPELSSSCSPLSQRTFILYYILLRLSSTFFILSSAVRRVQNDVLVSSAALSRELDYVTTVFLSCQHIFSFFLIFIFPAAFSPPSAGYPCDSMPLSRTCYTHLHTLFARLKAERPSSAYISMHLG